MARLVCLTFESLGACRPLERDLLKGQLRRYLVRKLLHQGKALLENLEERSVSERQRDAP